MNQRAFNERITMSLLRQCAWMWEHCMQGFNGNEGEFSFGEVMQGFGRNAGKSRVGHLFVEPILCQYWDVFNRTQPIDGLEFDRDEMMSRMTFIKDDGYDFRFSFPIDSVFSVTSDLGCPSLLNRTRFCYRDGQRWTALPEVQQPKPKTKASKAAPILEPSLVERLRQALQARLAA